MKQYMLIMTACQHDELKQHLFPGDGLEAAAVILCAQGSGRGKHRLIANEIITLPHKESQREEGFLSWPFAKHFPPDTITDTDKRELSVVTIHSHPRGFDKFSSTDDRNDRILFPSINGWFDDDRPNGAAIMMPDGLIRARIVDADGDFTDMDTVSVVGNTIRIWKQGAKIKKRTQTKDKLAQTFGSGTLKLLQSLRAGVVGCSGTGSIVMELLARNCIGKIVAVDNDRIEQKNLNRIINAKRADALHSRSKVEVLKKAVEQMGTDSHVDAYTELTDCPEVVAALVDCDVLFGCVDSAFGRYHLECIANAHCIPYFDVGVHLEADGKGGIDAADAVAHYVYPGAPGLLARGVYSMDQVTAEDYQRNDPAYYEKQKKAGYLAAVGEERPAVMSVNMQAACMAFNDFMARIHPFRMDDNREFAIQRFHLVHGHYENSTVKDHADKLFPKYAGLGDRSLLIKNMMRRV